MDYQSYQSNASSRQSDVVLQLLKLIAGKYKQNSITEPKAEENVVATDDADTSDPATSTEVETAQEFLSRADQHLNDDEYSKLYCFLAANYYSPNSVLSSENKEEALKHIGKNLFDLNNAPVIKTIPITDLLITDLLQEYNKRAPGTCCKKSNQQTVDKLEQKEISDLKKEILLRKEEKITLQARIAELECFEAKYNKIKATLSNLVEKSL